MTIPEILLIILIACVVIFLVYYFFRGSTGRMAITRPVESRVDEYLDRRFERIIEEWSLIRNPQLQKFKAEQSGTLDKDEEHIRVLKNFESDMKTNLSELEARLNALEDSLAVKKQ
jgi:hypothetical protein